MAPPLRVAVVGAGIGRLHVEAYRRAPDQFDLVALCDVDEARARELADAHAVPSVITDLDALCQRDDVQVIDLCTPPYLHFSQIQQVLASGKHVICEKPLVGSLNEVDAIALAEARSNRRVMPIFQYRFGQGLQKLKGLVDQGLAGQPYLGTVEVAWRRRANYYEVPWRGHWKTELVGAVLSHAIHAIDMLCYILGPARRVFASTATRVNPIEVEDCAAIALEMANGALATIAVTLGSSAEISRHRFCFSGLSAESSLGPYSNSEDPWTFAGDDPARAAQIEAALAAFVPAASGFEGQFRRFYAALQNGGELPVTLADARNLIELITAVYASAQTRQAVELPIGREHPCYGGWLPGESSVD
jgi:predicted dehydrogenase